MPIDTLIFDMDGVITTEEKYWACARLAFWELVTQTLGLPDAFPDAVRDADQREVIASDDLVYTLKGRSVNSNWDICYLYACIYMAALPGASVKGVSEVEPFLQALRQTRTGAVPWPQAILSFLESHSDIDGRPLVVAAGKHLQDALSLHDDPLLGIDGKLWWYLHARFQRFYHGETMREFGAPPIPDGTVIPADRLETALSRLQQAGFKLGVATGRPIDEMEDALGDLGLMRYFDPARMGTLDVARRAERQLGVTGLTKPHPFSLLRAIYPEMQEQALINPAFQTVPRPNVIMVGDSTSDPVMALAAGCRCVGVLTGVRGEVAKRDRGELLLRTGCEVVLEDVTHLPGWLAANRDR